VNDEIKIPLSKYKIILLFLGALIFLSFGIWVAIDPEKFVTIVFRNTYFIRIAGIASIAFFGVCAIFIFRKLFDKKYGLIIDKNGITDNSNATSIGFVKWTDISGIRVVQEFSQKFIMIDVSNPEDYIELKKSGIGKMAMKANYTKYGSPISITANALKLDFAELKAIIEKQYEKNALQHNL
tara:strand:- start:110 stop:655 length:546 start_codon:yes stop_codon:yes gene_type:complete